VKVLAASSSDLYQPGVVVILVYYGTTHGLRPKLAPRGEESPVRDVVWRKRVPHEDDVVRVHRSGPQIALDFCRQVSGMGEGQAAGGLAASAALLAHKAWPEPGLPGRKLWPMHQRSSRVGYPCIRCLYNLRHSARR
jgi:hypothetical protein